jgi:hypothetical protein
LKYLRPMRAPVVPNKANKAVRPGPVDGKALGTGVGV